jgi:hypothetical protein
VQRDSFFIEQLCHQSSLAVVTVNVYSMDAMAFPFCVWDLPVQTLGKLLKYDGKIFALDINWFLQAELEHSLTRKCNDPRSLDFTGKLSVSHIYLCSTSEWLICYWACWTIAVSKRWLGGGVHLATRGQFLMSLTIFHHRVYWSQDIPGQNALTYTFSWCVTTCKLIRQTSNLQHHIAHLFLCQPFVILCNVV